METNTGKRYETAMIAILYSKKPPASSRNDLLRAAAAVDTMVQRIVEDSLYLASRYTLFAADVQKLDSYRRGLTSPCIVAEVNDLLDHAALLSQQSHAVHVLVKNLLGEECLDKFVHLLETGCNVTGG
jgi:hypothetical protein